jgi:hypothetical protein
MSATRNVLAAFVTLTAATASAATGAIDPSVAIPSVRPSPVIPSSAFTAAFIGSVADDRGGDEVRIAQTWPCPNCPTPFLKLPYMKSGHTKGGGPFVKNTPQSRLAAPVRSAPVPVPHVPVPHVR